MCKVIQFQYTCEHYLKRRQSRCSGVYRKLTRNSVKAACCADAYITLKLPYDCNKCQQEAWGASWNRKLDRARTFHSGLINKNMPGAEVISMLIKELENEHANAAWNLRKILPPAYQNKTKIERVELGWKGPEQAKSPLKQEVRPDEVVLPQEKDNDDEDDDYVRSTDPFHPITNDSYAHPLENVDVSWIEEFLSPEELHHSAEGDTGFDCEAVNSWNWGDSADTTTGGRNADSEPEPEQDGWNRSIGLQANDNSELMAWGPEADRDSSIMEMGFDGLRSHKQVQQEQIEKVVKAFWDAVNTDDDDDDNEGQQAQHPATPKKKCQSQHPEVPTKHGHQSPHPTSPMPSEELSTSLLEQLTISDDSLGSYFGHKDPNDPKLDASSDTATPAQYIWTDGSADHPSPRTPPPPPSPSSPVSPTLPTSPTSTNSKYNKMRAQIWKYKVTDPDRYYAKWLQLSRMEIMSREGPLGRKVQDPTRGEESPPT